MEREALSQKERVVALSLNSLLGYFLFKWTSGLSIPTGGGESVWFLACLAYWILALIAAPYYRPPRDALGAVISCGLLLATIDFSSSLYGGEELNILRWYSVAFTAVVGFLAVLAIANLEKGDISTASKLLFRASNTLGRGEILFSFPVIISALGFYRAGSLEQIMLIGYWVVIAVIKPIEIFVAAASQITELLEGADPSFSVGKIERIDDPNIVRVVLNRPSTWRAGNLFVAKLADRRRVYTFPLYTQIQNNDIIGTGLCYGEYTNEDSEVDVGHVYQIPSAGRIDDLLAELSGSDQSVELIGFVVEGSSIGIIKIEVARGISLEEGVVIFANCNGKRVYYQILDAITSEEMFHQNPHGTHIAIAAQLGSFDSEKGFLKYSWVPSMNLPIFRARENLNMEASFSEREFPLGVVPSTNISAKFNLDELVEYHAAILGMTGTGKTELALDVIREALRRGTKVFCVDFTGEYRKRLHDCNPVEVGVTEKQGQELERLLFDVDTGNFKASEEKRALKLFLDSIRPMVSGQISAFLEKSGNGLAIFELAEVANTKATLRTTELFLSSIMQWARQNRKARQILIVLEEAHTIIPEAVGSGFDADTQWVVSRIGQIALQGRKYGVGLLIVSQRTALVSKTVLSQCNTYITHALVDQTSLNYLSSVYSADHIKGIPNLKPLHFLAFGKALKAERPLIISREWDPQKYAASQSLNQRLDQD